MGSLHTKETQYGKEEFDINYPAGYEKNFWPLARNYIIGHELKKFGLLQEKILEVGCGKGIVIKSLREQGFDCWGVELGEPEPVEGANTELSLQEGHRRM